MYRRLLVHDPHLGTKLLPGVRSRVEFETGPYLVQANEHGFRDDGWSVEKPEGVRRVLVYGDSFTYGVGVSAAERFTDRLAAAMPDVEFYNFGSVGSAPDEHLVTHRLVGAEFDFDLVLAAPWVENILRTSRTHRQWAAAAPDGDDSRDWVAVLDKVYFTLDDDGLTLHNEQIDPPDLQLWEERNAAQFGFWQWGRTLRWRVRNSPGLQDSLQRLSRRQPRAARLYEDPNGADWRLFAAIFRQWASELEVPLLVCPIPLYQHIEGDARADHVTARFAELDDPRSGLYTFDALPAMSVGNREQLRGYRFPIDIHFTAEGHAAFADAIEGEVRRVLDLTPAP